MKKKKSPPKPRKPGVLDSANWVSESSVGSGGSRTTRTSSSGTSTPIPQCTCECPPCYEGQSGKIDLTGDDTVLPSTGTAVVPGPELTQIGGGGSNMRLGEGLEYSGNGTGAGGGIYGKSWVDPHQPQLKFDGGNIRLESGPNETVEFLPSGSGSGNGSSVSSLRSVAMSALPSSGPEYEAKYFVRDKLTYDPLTQRFTVTSPQGVQSVFTSAGILEKIKDAFGNETILTYTLAGELVSMVTGTGADTLGYHYTFQTIAFQKRLTNVVMRVGGTTAASDFRQITYSYIAVSGELKKIVVDEKKDGAWSEIETTYYRYHATGAQKLRFVLNDHAYEQMHSVNPAWPEGATDAEIAQYADAEYAYQSDGRVNQVKTHGGKYTYGLAYATSTHGVTGMNVWSSKTTVTMPDGSTQTYYYNDVLSLLLKKVSEPQAGGDPKVWYPICQRFDGKARIILSAPSSAVGAVNENNRGNVTQADEYQTEIVAENLINRAESLFDGRNRLYRTKRYGVDITDDGALKPALTSELYYDQAGRTVRSTPAGSRIAGMSKSKRQKTSKTKLKENSRARCLTGTGGTGTV